jgi:oligosaccharide repeat unit polymerase
MSVLLDTLSSAWIPTSLLLVLTVHFRIRSGRWLAPSAFLGLIWGFILGASLLGVDHRVPGLGIWVIVALIAVFQVGSVIAEKDSNKTEHLRVEQSLLVFSLRRRTRQGSLFITLLALAGLTYFTFWSLKQYDLPFDLPSVIQLGARSTLLRYSGDTGEWSERLVAIWLYPAALLGGMLYPISEKARDRFLGLSSLLPALVYTFLTGARSVFLVGLACWLGGMWSVHVALSEGATRLFKKKSLLSLAAMALGLFFLFVVVDTFRGPVDTQEMHFETDNGRVRNYMFGSPAAFADWFQHPDDSSLRWGSLTFEGIYNLLGIRERILGTYTDAAQTVGQESTNIFTIFRGLIQDFTLPGAFLICGIWGFLSGNAYSSRSLRPWPAICLSTFYALALFTPLYCLFMFNGPILAWVVAWLVLRQRSQVVPSARFRVRQFAKNTGTP